MKTYIDPEPLINALKAIQKRSEIISVDEVLGVLAKYPAADVAEVVRCEHCSNSAEHLNGRWCKVRQTMTQNMDYCSYGEAKHG